MPEYTSFLMGQGKLRNQLINGLADGSDHPPQFFERIMTYAMHYANIQSVAGKLQYIINLARGFGIICGTTKTKLVSVQLLHSDTDP